MVELLSYVVLNLQYLIQYANVVWNTKLHPENWFIIVYVSSIIVKGSLISVTNPDLAFGGPPPSCQLISLLTFI